MDSSASRVALLALAPQGWAPLAAQLALTSPGAGWQSEVNSHVLSSSLYLTAATEKVAALVFWEKALGTGLGLAFSE